MILSGQNKISVEGSCGGIVEVANSGPRIANDGTWITTLYWLVYRIDGFSSVARYVELVPN